MWKKRGNVDKFFYDHSWIFLIIVLLFIFFGDLLGMRFWGKASWGDSLTISGLLTTLIGYTVLIGVTKHDKN